MMDMPKVKECLVEECSYNNAQICHALAITVGDGLEALCDTFWPGRQKGGDEEAVAKVGACRADSCKFNVKLECTAQGIDVATEKGKAVCETYTR